MRPMETERYNDVCIHIEGTERDDRQHHNLAPSVDSTLDIVVLLSRIWI